MLKELNNDNFKNETSNGLKLVDFYTTWCTYCKKQEEVLKELSDSGFWVGQLDCDKYPSIAKEHAVAGYPSFLLFKNGEKIAQFSGYHTKSQMLNKLTSYL